jgi:arylformamidase
VETHDDSQRGYQDTNTDDRNFAHVLLPPDVPGLISQQTAKRKAVVDRSAHALSGRNRTGGAFVKVFDISLGLSPTTLHWITGKPLELIERKRMSRGDVNNSSSIHTSVHAGTHVDAPFHFVPGGPTIEALDLDVFIGPARVCAIDAGTHITGADIQTLGLSGEARVLFKTRNSALLRSGSYDAGFAAFSADGASALADLGVRLVGLDYLSVAHADEQVPVHRAFLERGVILLEGIDLTEVPPGRYELFAAPVKLVGCDGAPCRAVLRELTV